MNLEALRAQFRIDADDKEAPYLCSDDDLDLYFNEAVEEAAIRAKLIFDATTAEVCEISLASGDKVKALHASVFEIHWAAFVPTASPTRVCELRQLSRGAIESDDPCWRTRTGEPDRLMHDDGQVQIVPPAPEAGTLRLEVYRIPLEPMTADSDVPEIAQAHHRYLVHWALHRAYSVPDSELKDEGRAAAALRTFENYFGTRPDAQLRRDINADVVHHNETYLI